MTISATTRLINIEEYHRMAEVGILGPEEKVELIQGQILEMSPVGSQHVAFVNKINALFIRLLPEAYITSVQNPIIVGPDSEPQPDIAILQPREDGYEKQLPTASDALLVIEVADTSLDYDREVKLRMYALAGIPEYWIVNLADRRIEVHHTPVQEQYRFRELVTATDPLVLRALQLPVPADKILRFKRKP